MFYCSTIVMIIFKIIYCILLVSLTLSHSNIMIVVYISVQCFIIIIYYESTYTVKKIFSRFVITTYFLLSNQLYNNLFS